MIHSTLACKTPYTLYPIPMPYPYALSLYPIPIPYPYTLSLYPMPYTLPLYPTPYTLYPIPSKGDDGGAPRRIFQGVQAQVPLRPGME